jgi:drug/metabolite transporter (DMT)-like permease
LAFFLWDIGMKKGDVPLLGVASYAAPVLSTLTLVLAGYAEPTAALAASCVLIVAGAVIATFAPARASAASPGAYSGKRR